MFKNSIKIFNAANIYAKKGTHGWGWYLKSVNKMKEEAKIIPEIPKPNKEYKRKEVVINFKIGKEITSNVKVELFDDLVPITCQNFLNYCDKSKERNYINCPIHYIKKNFLIATGDVIDGKHSKSSLSKSPFFDDENFTVHFKQPYILGMVNSGVHTNGSQFFITMAELPHMSGKNVGFGKVIEGQDIIKRINELYTTQKRSLEDVRINDIVI